MSEADQTQEMNSPQNIALPLFVYGALKPGMPAFEQLRPVVTPPFHECRIDGELFVRDGLPLLLRNGYGSGEVEGFLLHWIAGKESQGYATVCQFEPRKHYQWEVVDVSPGVQANVLVIRYPDKGNPQPLFQAVWRITDDAAFGPGLKSVQKVVEEVDQMSESDGEWERFFRSQMAYLLLWSILERLSALCLGPGLDPVKRIKRLHELPGMKDLVRENVKREDRVSDSRDPSDVHKLNGNNAKGSFNYYYQVRSNLSHRGKGVRYEFDKVHDSLKELLAITQQYLRTLNEKGAPP